MSKREILQNILPRLNSLISCELKLNCVTPDYIYGFYNDIYINISEFPPSLTYITSSRNDSFYFKIEYLQQTILEKYAKLTDETLNNFIYILEGLIQFSERIKKQVNSFPNFTDEDNRDIKLEKLFEKNTYIPLS